MKQFALIVEPNVVVRKVPIRLGFIHGDKSRHIRRRRVRIGVSCITTIDSVASVSSKRKE